MKKYRLDTRAPAKKSRIDFGRELNDEQRAAVTRGAGHALVIAGAGSGKTRTITYRVAWLIEQGVDPSSVLLVTFTNKAAREMLARVDAITSKGIAGKILGGTFHHAGNIILRRFGERVGLTPDFTILDPEDRADVLQSVLGECAERWRAAKVFGDRDVLSARNFPGANVIGAAISEAINRQTNLSDLLAERNPIFAEVAPLVSEVARGFAARKRERSLVDFDDLLLYWKALLQQDDDARASLRKLYRYVLVDEYQDTNKLQADIVDLFGGALGGREGGSEVTVVGDDCQSIYSFRGAHFANIMEFPDRYPGAKVFRLESNYRSTPQIVSLANRSIAKNLRQFPKTLHATRPDGEMPALVATRDVEQQAGFVAQRVLELADEKIPFDDIAVLYRNHHHSLELQVELARRGIPFEVRSGMRFFERAHIKDVIAHLRIVSNPRDEVAWIRVLRLYPRIGSSTAERIWRYLSGAPLEGERPAKLTVDPVEVVRRIADERTADEAAPMPARDSWKRVREAFRRLVPMAERPGELIETVLAGEYADLLRAREPDAQSRLDDLEQLATFARGYESTSAFLSEVALVTEVASEPVDGEDGQGRITLSTIHRAKGLEWRAVFLLWVNDGHLPSNNALDDKHDGGGEEEERRLFYVAVTRAKDVLHLVHPSVEIRRDGRVVLLKPSRFVSELGKPDPFERWEIEPVIAEPRDNDAAGSIAPAKKALPKARGEN